VFFVGSECDDGGTEPPLRKQRWGDYTCKLLFKPRADGTVDSRPFRKEFIPFLEGLQELSATGRYTKAIKEGKASAVLRPLLLFIAIAIGEAEIAELVGIDGYLTQVDCDAIVGTTMQGAMEEMTQTSAFLFTLLRGLSKRETSKHVQRVLELGFGDGAGIQPDTAKLC
jgi:hypothetical protein